MKGVELFIIVLVVATALGAIGHLISPGITGLQTLNQPPVQLASEIVVENTPAVFNLNDYFLDPDGDALFYFTDDPAFAIEENTLTLALPYPFANHTATIVVSDGTNTLAKPFTFHSAELLAPPQELSRISSVNPQQPLRGQLTLPIEPEKMTTSASASTQTSRTSSSAKGVSVACTSCGDCSTCLSSTGNTCTLTGPITSATDCITGMSTNTTLDCAGFTLTYNTGGGGTDFGISTGSVSGLVITNCDVIDGSTTGTNGFGLTMSGTSNSTIQGNTFRANGSSQNTGMVLSGTSAVNVYNNNIYAEGTAGANAALNISGSNFSGQVTGNVLYAEGTGATNFGLQLGVIGLWFANNTIEMGGVKASAGLINTTLNQNGINGSININGVLGSIITGNLIENNTIAGSVSFGALGTVSGNFSDNKLFQNTITATSTQTGVSIGTTNYTSILSNNITGGTGISLSELSLVTTLDDNTITVTGNGDGLDMRRPSLTNSFSFPAAFGNNISNSNTINGLDLLYLGGTGVSPACPNGTTLTTPAANHIHFIGCSDIILEDWTTFDAVTIIAGYNISMRRLTMRSGLDINGTGIILHNSTITSNKTRSNDGSLIDGSRIYIENNTFNFTSTNYVIGAYTTGTEYSIRNNTFVVRGGVVPTGVETNGDRYFIVNNSINDFATTGGSAFGIDWGASNSLVENNTILANGSNGCCNEGMDVSTGNNVTVRNNTFTVDDDGTGSTCCNYAVSGARDSWIIESNSAIVNGSECCNEAFIISGSNAIVNDNIIAVEGVNCCHIAIDISGTRQNESITNNIMTVFGTGADSDNYGIFFGTVTTANITNNTISATGTGTDHGGIRMSPGTRVIALNNIIFVNGTNSRGIWLTSTSNNNLFIGNNVSTDDGATYALSIEAAQNNNSFVNNTLNNTLYWINTLAGSTTQFNNTRFLTSSGAVNLTSVNITGASNIARNVINISSNRTFVNTTNISALNSSGIVELTGLAFSNAQPLIDTNDDGVFATCSSPECDEVSYTGGTFIFNTSHFTSHSASEATASAILCNSCVNCTICAATSGNTCQATNAITAPTTCINMTANNVIMDCAGFEMNYDTGGASSQVGVAAANRNNITVRNCFIRDTTAAGGGSIGINFSNTQNSTIQNNSIITNGTSLNFGIRLVTNNNVTIDNNSITTRASSFSNYAIYLTTGTNHTIVRNNYLNPFGPTSGAIGLKAETNIFNTTVYNNSVFTAGSGVSNYGIAFDVGTTGNNTINNNSINTSSSSGATTNNVGARLVASYNNSVTNNVIRTHGTSTNYGITVSTTPCDNNTFINNAIHSNGTSTDNDGIRLTSFCSGTLADGNFIITNGTSSNRPISTFVGHSNTTIRNNILFANGNANQNQGVVVTDGANFSITNNTIRTNGTDANHGIFLLRVNHTFTSNNSVAALGTTSNNVGIAVNTNGKNHTIFRNTIITNGTSSNFGIELTTNVLNNTVQENAVVTNGTFDNMGIRILHGNASIVYANNATTLGTENDNNAIQFFNTTNNTVIGNFLNATGITTGNDGVDASNSSNNTFINNTVHAFGSADNTGFDIYAQSFGSIVSGNSISTNGTGNTNEGISAEDTAHNTFTNNTIITNGGVANNGIGFINTNHSFVQNNTIRTNGTSNNNVGVDISGASNNFTIRNNSLLTNGSDDNHGVELVNTGYLGLIEHNTIVTDGTLVSDGFDTGLYFHPARIVTVQHNSIITRGGPFSWGIGLDTVNGTTIYNNTIVTNGTSQNMGVRIDFSSSNNTVRNNTITTDGTLNNNFGITVSRSIHTAVENNVVRTFSALSHGLRVTSASNNTTFVNNTVYATGNNSYGIAIGGGALGADANTFNNTHLINTTGWILVTTSNLTNLTNTSFETQNGSIVIPGMFNLSGTINITRSVLNISSNLSYLNSSNASFLNTSAQITLRGITFTDPRPRVDFEDDGVFTNCNPPNCVEISYTGGEYVFNVTSFTSYAAQENLTFVINLSAEKADTSDPVARGSQLSYTITLNNSGNGTAYNVTVLELYPAETSFVSGQPTPSGNDTFSIGDLAPGASFVVNITVNVSSAVANGTPINNTANVTFFNDSGENFSFLDSELTTVLGAPVIVSIKSDTPDPVVKGSMLNYSILVNNTGDDTAFNVTLTEMYPAGISFVSAEPTPIGNNTFTIGTLAPNETFVVNITVTVGSNIANGTILNNSVNASWRNVSGQQAGVSDSETTTVLGIAVLTVVKTDSPDPVNNGSVLSYTITITNTGDEIAYNVTAVDGYPFNVSLTSTAPAPTSGNDTFTLGNLLPGANTTINITVTVDTNMTSGVLNNTVNVTFTNTSGVNETMSAFQATTVTIPAVPAAPSGGGGGGSNFFRNANVTREQPAQVVPVTWPTVLATTTPPAQELPTSAEQLTEELAQPAPQEIPRTTPEITRPNATEQVTNETTSWTIALIALIVLALILATAFALQRPTPHAKQREISPPPAPSSPQQKKKQKQTQHGSADLEKLDSDIQKLEQMMREFSKNTRR